jgi:hypothetical protein
MHRVLVSLLLLFCTPTAFACMVANGGPEFDKLVEVTKTEEEGVFHLSVPARVKNSDPAQVYINHYKLPFEEFNIIAQRDQIKVIISGDMVDQDISIKVKPDHIVYIQVWWPGDVCSTSASVKIKT